MENVNLLQFNVTEEWTFHASRVSISMLMCFCLFFNVRYQAIISARFKEFRCIYWPYTTAEDLETFRFSIAIQFMQGTVHQSLLSDYWCMD